MKRVYCFCCDSCYYEFDQTLDSEEIVGYKTKCPQCSSKKCYRDYFRERVSGDTGPKTLGMLADLNASKRKNEVSD